MSKDERLELDFYYSNLKPLPNIVMFKQMLVDKVPAAWVMRLAAHALSPTRIDELANWTVPVFPFDGQWMLEQGVPQGKAMGKILRALKDKWATNNWQLTESDALEAVKEMK